MKQPQIDLIPSRPAVCSDASVTLDVLVKITPPAVATAPKTLELSGEAEALAVIEDHLKHGDELKFMRRAQYQAYQRRQSKAPDL